MWKTPAARRISRSAGRPAGLWNSPRAGRPLSAHGLVPADGRARSRVPARHRTPSRPGSVADPDRLTAAPRRRHGPTPNPAAATRTRAARHCTHCPRRADSPGRRSRGHPGGLEKPTFPIFNRKSGVCGTRVSGSTRFQQLWKILWITSVLSLQINGLAEEETGHSRSLVTKGNQWTFRGSPGYPLWKIAPHRGYNDRVFLAHAVPAYPKGPALPTSPSAQASNPPKEGVAAAPAGAGAAVPARPGTVAPGGPAIAFEERPGTRTIEAILPPATRPASRSTASLRPPRGVQSRWTIPRDRAPRRSRAIPATHRDPHCPVLLLGPRAGRGPSPIGVFRELIENLVHASFAGVVITILDGGNTVRVSDQGPGIPDKEAALRPGFTSAEAERQAVHPRSGLRLLGRQGDAGRSGRHSGDRGQPRQGDGRHGPSRPRPRKLLSRRPRPRPIISLSASLRFCC